MNYNTLIICGKEDAGKTTSIKKLIDKITNSKSIGAVLVEGNLKKQDVVVKLVLPNGKTIGVISAGDKKYSLELLYKRLDVCDFYVGATHSYGDTVEFFLEPQDAKNGKHNFSVESSLFIRKVKGRNDNDKLDKGDNFVLQSNDDFSSILYEILTKVIL